ncbi:MAG: hypothetical protein ABJC55_09240, partial [Algoriphagus sp.]
YSNKISSDSLAIDLSLTDSVGFRTDSLIYAKFEESERRPEKLTVSPNSGKSFHQQLDIELTFNKPIVEINYDSLYLTYDTAAVIAITPEMMSFKDSLRRDILQINLSIPDSIPFELYTVKAADSTFMDIEGQYNEVELSANYKKLKRETLADAISGTIQGSEGPFIVELLDSKGEIKRDTYLATGNKFTFNLIEAGKYEIRVIEDSNGNRRWDPANFEEKRYAERTFNYIDSESGNKTITIRGGWTIEDLVIDSTPKTGKIDRTN